MRKLKNLLKRNIFALMLYSIIVLNMSTLSYAADMTDKQNISNINNNIMEAINSAEDSILLEEDESKINPLPDRIEPLQNEVSANQTRSSDDIKYSTRFSLVTLYRHNKTIHSNFNFVINVKNNNKIEIKADGPYRDAGYVWGDDYEIYIYDRYNNQKFYDRVTYGGDVYTDANTLLRRLNNVNINVRDNILIRNKYYQKTVNFSFEDGTLYTNGSDVRVSYALKEHKYAMTEFGFIKQPIDEELVVPSGMFYDSLLLNVVDDYGRLRQGKLDFENDSSGRVYFNSSEFGPKYSSTWAETYAVNVYGKDGLVKTGFILRKGASVEETIASVEEAFENTPVQAGDRIIFGTSGNLSSLKLVDNSRRYYAKPFISVFTCTNTNFSNGVNGKTEFIITDYGLIENKNW